MNTTHRRILGLALLLILFVGGGYCLMHFGVYGWTIFALFPVCLGGLASWVFRPATPGKAASLGAVANFAALTALLMVRWEGLICIVMVMPLALPLGALGGWLMYLSRSSKVTAPRLTMLMVLPSASLLWDAKAPPEVFAVRSSIEIAASPAQVWKDVVSFSDIPEPQEWFFQLGVAYPQRARIEGNGPGAVRYCEFSTGPFVEPIVVWDEPRLLRFRVTQNPAPLHEWTFYGSVFPKHLHGYMISKQGQFRLVSLANNHTLLEGTTWYQHGLWPAFYWRWWSDAIIHRIHMRVLNHIRILAEAGATAGS